MTQADLRQFDVAVIGAGPAGMAASIRAAQAGVKVALSDEHAEVGGSVWRGIAAATGQQKAELIRQYPRALEMLDDLARSNITHFARARDWEVSREGRILFSRADRAVQLSARRIILATGAVERPMPFAGWTLPGVMTAGAAQMMLKTSALVPEGPVALAGSGPLLYLVATQLVAAGRRPAAIVDTTPRDRLRKALLGLPWRVDTIRTVATGLAWQRRLRRAGVVFHRAASGLEALGDTRVTGLRFRTKQRTIDLPCATLLIHNGIVPNVQLSRAIGLAHDWDGTGLYWHPRCDDRGRTDIEGIFVAGDGAGIAGAEAAGHSGRLAALAALEGLAADSAREVEAAQRALARQRAIRPFLESLFAVSPEFLSPDNETIICRCEEVTAGKVRQMVRQHGCDDPNAVKSLCRAGMGPCQGRYCGLTVSQLVAEARGLSPAQVGYFRLRWPAKPITLAELAGLQVTEGRDG